MAGLLFLTTPGSTFAASLSWTGAANADWFNAANWSPAQIPSSIDAVVIDQNATVTASGATSISFATLALGDAAGSFAPTLRLSAAQSSGGAVTIFPGAKLQQDTNQQIAFGALTVMPGGTLTHAANSTARSFVVNLSVTGDFDLRAGATIAVDAVGYAKGAGPGAGSTYLSGSGGGHGGRGGDSAGGAAGGAGYDALSNPVDLGSGGGNGNGGIPGGAGGGAAIINVQGTFTLAGLITANGASAGAGTGNGGGGGAGGTVNLTAASLAGAGIVQANGGAGNGSGSFGGGGGGGRIAIVVSGSDNSSLTLRADNGNGGGAGASNGGAGVIALKTPGGTNYNLSIGDLAAVPQSGTGVAGSSTAFSTVTLNNSIVSFDAGSNVTINALVIAGGATLTGDNFFFGSSSPLTVLPGGSLKLTANALTFPYNSPIEVQGGGSLGFSAGTSSGGALVVRNGGTFQQLNSQVVNFNTVIVEPGGLLTHAANASTKSSALNLAVSGDFDLQAGATISADAVGYAKGAGPGAGSTNMSGSGGGHGGRGGDSAGGAAGGASYDNPANPVDLGSGGGNGNGGIPGGAGGGVVLINVQGIFRFAGIITANGGNAGAGTGNGGGGGAGGTVNLTATTLVGAGSVQANGGAGNGSGSMGGGGGGGVIALTGCNAHQTRLKALGGIAGSGAGAGASGSFVRTVPAACPSPPTPSGLAVSGMGTDFLTASWSAAAGAQSYTLQASTDPAFEAGVVTTTTSATSATASGLSLRTVYYLRVYATNDLWNSDYSPAVSATTPGLPENLHWAGAASGDWFGASNWSPAYTPTSVDDVTIDANVTVTVSSASKAVFRSLVLGDAAGSASPILKVSGIMSTPGSLVVNRNATLLQDATAQSSFGSVAVLSGGKITHSANAGQRTRIVDLNVSGDFTLQSGATIAVDGMGYAGGLNANGSGPGGGVFSSQGGGGGGGHGGSGGSGSQGDSFGGAAYDSLTAPSDLGSGGSGSMQGGAGGGAVILRSGGVMRIDGLVSANGFDGASGGSYNAGGGGAGGAVNLRAATLVGTGAVRAGGGAGGNGGYTGFSGGGGGGRIAILVDQNDASSLSLSAGGGRGISSGGRAAASGGAGTISLKTSGGANYNLSIGDLTLVPTSSTPVTGADASFSTVTLNNSLVSFDPGSTVDINSLVIVGLATVTAHNLVFGADAPILISSGAVLNLTANSLSFAGSAPIEVKGGAVFKLAGRSISGGALNVRGGGIFQQTNAARLDFVSVLVERGGLLTHASNTNSLGSLLNLSVSDDFTLQAGATIAVDGMGYAGGLNANGSGPGGGAFASQGGGGGGGGHGGGGGYGSQVGSLGGSAYDSLTDPADLGSGGSGSKRGGAGGGAVILRSGGSMRIDGLISANGLDGASGGSYDAGGGGAGGTVNLRAATLSGTGAVRADGGAGGNGGYTGYSGGGAGGRIAILVDSSNASSLNLLAGGGSGYTQAPRASASGGAGTIATRGPAASLYSLTLSGSSPLPQSPTPLPTAPPSFDAVVVTGTATVTAAGTLLANTVEVRGGGVLLLDSSLKATQMTVKMGGTVGHSPGSAKGCDLSVSGTLNVEAGGRISADGAGFGPGQGPGAGYANNAGPYDDSGGGGGGGYGGLGGRSDSSHQTSGALYGSFAWPGEFGSGGGTGNSNPGGSGGGLIKIKAGTLQLDGSISANGQNGADSSGSSTFYAAGGGGSGGAIIVSASDFRGAGTISADGGASVSRDRLGGGGGGGRVALYYGTKSGSWAVSADGGAGRYSGNPGTILDNGVLSGLDVSAAGGTLAASRMTQTLQSEQSLTETISAQTLDFSGALSTGVPPGSFTSAQMSLVLVKTGSFVDRGFFRGEWTLALSSSTSLGGSWEGIASLASNEPRRLILKGTLRGQIRASLDGTLAESSPGSGVFDRLSASCRVVLIDAVVAANDMYISGIGRSTGGADYPDTRLSLLQTSLVGQLGGYYSGAADMTFTFLRVNSPGNPFQGEGFLHANYVSPQGNGEGWAYAAAFDQAARLDGVFNAPLKGLAEGALTLSSPRALTLTLQNLDVGIALKPILSLEISGPEQYLNWGSTVTMAISLYNNGYAAADDVAAVAIFPEWSDFVSASGDYVRYDVAHWRGSFYIAKPFLRWDFASVPARGVVKMYYQLFVRPPGASAPAGGTNIGGDVKVGPKAWADHIFAYYPPGGTQ